jgi:hypothetical protein
MVKPHDMTVNKKHVWWLNPPRSPRLCATTVCTQQCVLTFCDETRGNTSTCQGPPVYPGVLGVRLTLSTLSTDDLKGNIGKIFTENQVFYQRKVFPKPIQWLENVLTLNDSGWCGCIQRMIKSDIQQTKKHAEWMPQTTATQPVCWCPITCTTTPFKPQMIDVEQSSIICRFNFVIYCGYLLLVKLRP